VYVRQVLKVLEAGGDETLPRSQTSAKEEGLEVNQKYPTAVSYSLLGVLGGCFLCLLAGSPPHRGNDPLFFFILANTCGLLWLCIMLHHEKREAEREDWIRAFFLLDVLLGVVMAGYVIWKRV
jgi:hypothetical protein